MNRRLAVDKSVRRKNRGFTLLEILVALLVLSIGLLGLAGLQTFSLRNNHSAFLRSQAVVLAYDALDRLRSNRDQAMLGTGSAYNTSYSEAASSYSSTGCASPPPDAVPPEEAPPPDASLVVAQPPTVRVARLRAPETTTITLYSCVCWSM